MLEFYLERKPDGHELSGKGKVAHGFVFQTSQELKDHLQKRLRVRNGYTVFLEWIKAPISVGVYKSLEDLIDLHGHLGLTEVKFIVKEKRKWKH